MNFGTSGAFLVLESLEHATARGAHIYARLDAVAADRGPRDGDRLEQRLERLTAEAGASGSGADTLVFSGASGFPDLSAREREFLKARFPQSPLRTIGALFGHSLEAQFPTGLALACLALDSGAAISPFAAGGRCGRDRCGQVRHRHDDRPHPRRRHCPPVEDAMRRRAS